MNLRLSLRRYLVRYLCLLRCIDLVWACFLVISAFSGMVCGRKPVETGGFSLLVHLTALGFYKTPVQKFR